MQTMMNSYGSSTLEASLALTRIIISGVGGGGGRRPRPAASISRRSEEPSKPPAARSAY